MALSVLREGVAKSHMVFWAPAVLPLTDSSSDNYRFALNIVAHECGHVEDLKIRDLCFPGTILKREITNPKEIILERYDRVLWEEYAACRSSSIFAEGQEVFFINPFVDALRDARERGNSAIRSYRRHADIDKVLEEAVPQFYLPLRYAACLIGHQDGRNGSLDNVFRDISGNFYEPYIKSMINILHDLWSRRGKWNSEAEFDPLKILGRKLIADCGISFKSLPNDRVYINIPLKPETTPE